MMNDFDLILVALRASLGMVTDDRTMLPVKIINVGEFVHSKGVFCINITENKLIGIYRIYPDSFGNLHLSKYPFDNTGMIKPSLLAAIPVNALGVTTYNSPVGYIRSVAVV